MDRRLRAELGERLQMSAGAVSMALTELQRWGVVRKVTIEVEARRALAAAKVQAEQASRAKTAFLANTSHEMRTPLHGVLGLARLARESRDEQTRQGYLDSLLESAQALSCTISDVLDVSRIEAGRLAIQRAQFERW